MPPITSLLVLIKTNGLCLHSIRKEGWEGGRKGERQEREERKQRKEICERKSQEAPFLSAILRKVSVRW